MIKNFRKKERIMFIRRMSSWQKNVMNQKRSGISPFRIARVRLFENYRFQRRKQVSSVLNGISVHQVRNRSVLGVQIFTILLQEGTKVLLLFRECIKLYYPNGVTKR